MWPPRHWYLKPLAALGDERPVIFYDQLGNGLSEHPADTLVTVGDADRALDLLERIVAPGNLHPPDCKPGLGSDPGSPAVPALAGDRGRQGGS